MVREAKRLRSRRIVPLDIWYIIPVEVCTPQPMLRFYPHRQARRMRLEPYREAWHLLDPPLTIHACIDPDYLEASCGTDTPVRRL